MASSDSEMSDSDLELQEAFAKGHLKPGLNIAEQKKEHVNNVGGLNQKLAEFKSSLTWIELLDCVNKQAPLAPELAAQMLTQEQKRENQLKNNKKLPQFAPSEDPVLNDFKRETIFHRQAQGAVLAKMVSSDSEMSDSDLELQEAFAKGHLKPGLNIAEQKKEHVNNVGGLNQKLAEFKSSLTWIELLDCVNKQAPLAPELAAQMLTQEQKRENQLKNNKKLPQFAPSEDPVLNDFKRETIFHRQAQGAVLECVPRLKALGLAIIRPDDYFAEMAKTDDHMQKIRENLMKQQEQQKRSERMKQLRNQKKEGKQLQIQAKLQRHKDKKDMLDQVKKVRKGLSSNLDFLDGKKSNKPGSGMSKKAIERKKSKDKKFGFGGKKRGLKTNTKESAGDISEYRAHKKPKIGGKGGKGGAKQRPGKNRRLKSKNKK